MISSTQTPKTETHNEVAKPGADRTTATTPSTTRLQVSTRIKAGTRVKVNRDG